MARWLGDDFDPTAHNAKVAAWRDKEAKRSNDQRAKADSGPLSQVAQNCPTQAVGVDTAAASSPSSKYGNKRTNGYASKRESERAFQLRLMQEAGAIRNLQEQVEFLLIPKQEGERACKYRADFVYEEWGLVHYDDETTSGWRKVVEDCKGYRTEVYRIKRKLMQMVHGIKVRET